jgi:(R,R)-butanediol dehydrogenase/meso-butanediol dehydrogenase/diacetyl reductase
MNALVWRPGPSLAHETVPEPPPPTPGQAIVEVAFCGICGTDISEYTHGPVMIRPGPHPLTGARPPMILGHEFSGRVAALGPGADGFQVGQRVVVDPCWRCGECFWCQRGDYQICKVGGSVGLASDGALARYVTVPAEGLVALPDSVDDQVAALTEPLAVALHAAHRGEVQAGSRVLIQGYGPIGAAVLLASRACGAKEVFVSEPSAARRELAGKMGASAAFDPAACSVRAEVYQRTGRIGPDVVFECTGIPALLEDSVSSVRKGGRVVAVGIGPGSAQLPGRQIVPYEREIVGSLGYRGDLPRVVELLASGRMDPKPLITSVVSLEEAIPGAFDVLAGGASSEMKILIDVRAS